MPSPATQPTLVRLDLFEFLRLSGLIGAPLVTLIVLVITTKVQLEELHHRLDRIERVVDIIAYDHATRRTDVQQPPVGIAHTPKP